MTIKKIFTLGLGFVLPLMGMAQNEITVFDDQTGENEEIDLPEGMRSAEVDSLLREWNTKNYLSVDESCQSNGENPEFTKEEYINRLSRLPNVIDMPYNDVVRKFIDQYSGRLRRTVSIMLGASNFYFPLFEEALERFSSSSIYLFILRMASW